MLNFVDFITRLAPEGETALFVRQKPRTDGNGQMQFHADGAIKATWPAYLPGREKAGQAWYGNTGSFVVDRFVDGKPSASAACCDYVLVMVLDDVGDADKAPKASPVPPTWVMETSPGSYQWGYAFDPDDQPTKGAYSAAIRAIAAAGYSDPGAINPVRNFRLPGSVNLKPGKNLFESRLVEFHPDRVFKLPELCKALGVEPGPDDSGGVRAVRLSDDGADDVLAWLSAQGLVLAQPNGEGWAGVVCPNHEAHTDGNPEGRYMSVNRAYCCYHGHCEDWSSARFLDWVAEQGGPAHAPGLRDDLLAARMSATLSKLTPTEAFPDAAAAVVAEVERREAGRVEREGWFERFAYLHADDGYFDLMDRKQYTRANFNATYRHVTCWSVHSVNGKRRRVEASISFDENRQAMGARVLQGVTYAPGESVLVSRSGDVYANLWRDARPIPVDGDASPWLGLLARLLPDPVEREYLLDWMAYKVQHPEHKINHGVLLGGAPGIGKDSVFEPFIYAIGGSSRENVALIKNEELNSQWGYSLMSEVLVINELRQADASDRRALENRLKPLLAAPPELIPVNRKNLHPFDALNRLSVVAFSNERMAITLPSDDRRWYVLWSDARPLRVDEARAIWAWYGSGGRAIVAGYLHARDVSSFAPGGTPPMTEAKAIMLAAGLSAVESALVEMMRQRRGEFALGAVQGPWQALVDRLQAIMPAGTKCSVHALFHALREAGWIDLGRVKTATDGNKVHVYAAQDTLDRAGGNRSEIRRMLDAAAAGGPGPGGLRAVK